MELLQHIPGVATGEKNYILRLNLLHQGYEIVIHINQADFVPWNALDLYSIMFNSCPYFHYLGLTIS